MDDRDPAHPDPMSEDHWEMFAQAMDLTIEGHRLIAEEIGHELKLVWRVAVDRLRELTGTATRRFRRFNAPDGSEQSPRCSR
jgi:hypothetical protein